MKVFLCLAAVVAVAYALPAGPVADTLIPGSYSIILKDDVALGVISQHLEGVTILYNSHIRNRRFLHVMDMLPQVAAKLAAMPQVHIVEQDRIVSIYACIDQPNDADLGMNSWHLIRTTHVANPGLTESYRFDADGGGVDIYIMDTGIDLDHPEFATGRASHEFVTTILAGQGYVDDHGHGTHVAGLAGGNRFGVAQASHLYNVKVLGANGSGTAAGITSGIVHIHNRILDARAGGGTPRSIINMSLGGGAANQAQEDAINAAVADDIFFIVAAGNDGADAAGSFPAAYPAVITVGATDTTDGKATWSNHGLIVDVMAPGVSTWAAGSRLSSWCDGVPDLNNCFIAISGTSMACPVVAGIVARHLSPMLGPVYNQQTQEGLRTWVHGAGSTPDVVSVGPTQGETPNRLIHLDDCPPA